MTGQLPAHQYWIPSPTHHGQLLCRVLHSFTCVASDTCSAFIVARAADIHRKCTSAKHGRPLAQACPASVLSAAPVAQLQSSVLPRPPMCRRCQCSAEFFMPRVTCQLKCEQPPASDKISNPTYQIKNSDYDNYARDAVLQLKSISPTARECCTDTERMHRRRCWVPAGHCHTCWVPCAKSCTTSMHSDQQLTVD